MHRAKAVRSSRGSIDAIRFRCGRRRAGGGRVLDDRVRAGRRARRRARAAPGGLRSEAAAHPRQAPHRRRCAAASSTISPAAPARAMRCNSARSPRLDTGEGKVAPSDLRSTTWEDGGAKSFRFNSQNSSTTSIVDAVDGNAERGTRAGRGEARQAEAKSRSTSPRKWCFRPSICAASSRRRAPARRCWSFRSMTARKTARRSISTLTVIGQRDRARPEARRCGGRQGGARAASSAGPSPSAISTAGRRGTASRPRSMRSASSFYENGISRALCARLRRLRRLRHHEAARHQGHRALQVRVARSGGQRPF